MLVTDGTVGTVSLVSSHTDGWAGSNNIGRISYGDEEEDLYRNGFLAAFLMTPYGYHQVARVIYGSVIDHIEEVHIKRVLIPEAPPDVQVRIGQKVVDAFEKKDEAAVVEKQTIKRLEQYIEQAHQTHTNLHGKD
jgi:restriction endonuclease S subunit